MRNWESLSLRISSLLLVLCGYLSLVSVREYGAFVLIFPALLFTAMPLCERLDERFPVYRQLTRALQVAYIFFIPYTYLTLGRVDALLALIIFIQAYSLLHVKTARNYYHLFLMAFFMLLTASVQSPEPMIALVMGLFLVSAVWSLAALRLEAEAHHHVDATLSVTGPGGNGVEDRLAVRMHVGVSIVSLVLAVFALTVGLFLFTPRIEAGLFGSEVEAPSLRTGLNDSVDLRNSGLLEPDSTAVMHVEFPDLEGGFHEAPLYWRSTTLPQYVGGQWVRRGLSDHLESIGPQPLNPFRHASLRGDQLPTRVQRPKSGKGTLVRQEIFMDNVPEQGLPCLDLVQEVSMVGQASGSRLQWDPFNDFTVVFETRGPRRLTYDVWSEVIPRDPDALRKASEEYELCLPQRDYLLLTEHDLLPETVALAKEVIGDADNAYDKASALERWLSGDDFTYTTDLPPLPARNPIDAFITKTRRGHCELFGSALALMLRSQGIPTRVVTGYRDAEWDPGSQSYIVRARNAHLWVEVLFPGHGWVVFDPSPRVDPALDTLAGVQQSFSRAVFELKMFWYESVLGYESEFQLSSLRDFAMGLFRGRFEFNTDTGMRKGFQVMQGFTTLFVLGALAWALLLVARRRRPGRARRYVLTGDQTRAVRLYRRTVRRLRKVEQLREGKTAEEVAALIAGEQGADSEALALIRTYNEVRFGRRPLTKAHYARLRKQLAALRSS